MDKGKRKKWENIIACLMLLLCLLAGGFYLYSVAAEEELNNGNDGSKEASGGQEAGFSLTPEEEEYLEGIKSRAVVFGIAEASAYSTRDGAAYGTFVPVLEVLEEVFGLNVEVVSNDWATSRELLLGGEIDFLYGLPAKQGKDAMEDGVLLYSADWLYTNPMYLAAKQEGGWENGRLGMRLGLLDGFAQAEEIAAYLSPAEIVRYAAPEEMLQGLYGGQVDALVVAESFQECLYGADGIEVLEELSRFASYTAFATAKEEYQELIELFNRYLAENMVSGGTAGEKGEQRKKREQGKAGKQEKEGEQREKGEQGRNIREDIQFQKKDFLKSYIMETEAAAIQAAAEEYDAIRYAFSSTDSMPLSYQWGKERIGIFEGLMSFITANTGLSFEKESMTGADAAAALDENDIQLLVGELSRSEDMDGGSAFTPLIAARLVPAAGIEKLFGKEQVGYYYWGIEENYMPLLEGTIFDGRSISYENKEAVLQAYQNGEVGGVLLKEGCLDFDRLADGKEKYKAVEGIFIPALEGVSYNQANEGLNALLKRLIAIYRLVCREDIKKWKIQEKSYYLAILGDYAPQKKELHVWRIAGIVLAGLLLLSLFGQNGKKKKKKKKKQEDVWSAKKENTWEDFWKTGQGRVGAYSKKETATDSSRRTAGQSERGMARQSEKGIARQSGRGTARQFHGGDAALSHQKNAAARPEPKASAKAGEGMNHFFKEEIDDILAGTADMPSGVKGRTTQESVSTRVGSRAAQESVSMRVGSEAVQENGAMRGEDGADALTGLVGEHSGRKRIEEILKQYPQEQAVFSYLDLKKLKQVNHTYGYRTGDEVLVSFAKSLKTLELDPNTVVFRVDGDKFGAFRGNLQSELDYQLYLGELQSLSAQARADGKLVYASYCCSAAVYRKDADDLKGLMKCADAALQAAKRQGLAFAAWEEESFWSKRKGRKRKK